MGAALLSKIGPMLLGSATSRLGAIDKTTMIVRGGRFVYLTSVVYIGGAWYAGWKNQRVHPGRGRFPVPGLDKLPVVRPGGAEDAPDVPDVSAGDVMGQPLPQPGIGGTPNPIPVPGIGGSPNLLVYLAEIGRTRFHLRPSEHPKYGGVHAGHSATSFHKRGRAVDLTGTVQDMANFANWVAQNYGTRVSELFWRGANWVNIDNGRRQGYNYSGALAAPDGHKRHVHLAI